MAAKCQVARSLQNRYIGCFSVLNSEIQVLIFIYQPASCVMISAAQSQQRAHLARCTIPSSPDCLCVMCCSARLTPSQIAIAKQILELNSEIKCFLSYRIYIQLFLSSCQFFVLLIFIRWLAGCHQTDFQKKIYDIARSCLANILVFYCYFIFMVYIIAIHATAQLFQTEWNSTLKIKYRFLKKYGQLARCLYNFFFYYLLCLSTAVSKCLFSVLNSEIQV